MSIVSRRDGDQDIAAVDLRRCSRERRLWRVEQRARSRVDVDRHRVDFHRHRVVDDDRSDLVDIDIDIDIDDIDQRGADGH